MYIPRSEYPKPSKKIIIFSGAGLDQPSGIKTFRDTNGLWNNYSTDVVCNEDTWKLNLSLVHEFYNERRQELATVQPNVAHFEIKKIIEKYGVDNVFNITMNVSDFFERLDTEVLHLHGELRKMECIACGHTWDIEYEKFDIKTQRCANKNCNSVKGVRPKIVFFGGQAPMYSYFNRALEYLDNPDSIVVVIGTQGNVIPIFQMLKNKKCYKILCNMEKEKDINDTDFDDVYFESVETAIPKISQNIEEVWGTNN